MGPQRTSHPISLLVPKKIRDKTTKCAHAFGCLDSGKCGECEMCRVNRTVGNKALLLHSEETSGCLYRVSFGFGQFCTCPTHLYIHSRQRKSDDLPPFPSYAKIEAAGNNHGSPRGGYRAQAEREPTKS